MFSLQFSPTGEQWAAATTEGLLIYSLTFGMVFDPWDLQLLITPDSIKKAIKEDDHVNGIHKKLKLTILFLISYIFSLNYGTEVE